MERDNIEKIELPFEQRSFDLFIWSYDHRYGLCVVIIFYLIVSIAFVSARIAIESRRPNPELMIELPELEELQQRRDELQKVVEVLQQQREIDWESIRNELSNEEAQDEQQMRELIESGEAFEQMDALSDELSAEEFLADNARLKAEMAKNQLAYQEELEELERSMIQMRERGEPAETQERRDANLGGGVTASYSFTYPVRHAQSFIIPAYKCLGGGEVRIAVLLDRKGSVISAEHLAGGDECMQRHAIDAAMRSTFNANPSAPNPHRGTITYFYIPQL
ncbi:MAG: energy transducer TonB [Rikenellaceae bacterium]